jgi:hypothetical protein
MRPVRRVTSCRGQQENAARLVMGNGGWRQTCFLIGDAVGDACIGWNRLKNVRRCSRLVAPQPSLESDAALDKNGYGDNRLSCLYFLTDDRIRALMHTLWPLVSPIMFGASTNLFRPMDTRRRCRVCQRMFLPSIATSFALCM